MGLSMAISHGHALVTQSTTKSSFQTLTWYFHKSRKELLFTVNLILAYPLKGLVFSPWTLLSSLSVPIFSWSIYSHMVSVPYDISKSLAPSLTWTILTSSLSPFILSMSLPSLRSQWNSLENKYTWNQFIYTAIRDLMPQLTEIDWWRPRAKPG